MSGNRFALLVMAVLPVFAGCVQATLHERKGSLYTCSEGDIGKAPTKDFLTSRTAVLISGDHLTITQPPTNSERFDFKATSRTFGIGCATAVDRRGYFLTASHAVGKEPPWLIFGPGNKLQARPGQVVWRGVVTNGEPDLALLYVPCALGEVFEWGSDFKTGDRIIAVGSNQRRKSFDFQVVCLTGALRECASNSVTDVRRAVFHTAPLHRGDSGGPLVAMDGRLIGIDVRCTKVFSLLHPFGRRLNCAEHPDLPSLRKVIERHEAEARVQVSKQ
jgi:S1-C subfamily serine protease